MIFWGRWVGGRKGRLGLEEIGRISVELYIQVVAVFKNFKLYFIVQMRKKVY